ncbi:MAG: F0F1 ATP synthase subunit alpha [bacterium]
MRIEEMVRHTLEAARGAVEDLEVQPRKEEIGRVVSTGDGIATLVGLSGARSGELLQFPGELRGIVFNLDPGEVGCILLGPSESVSEGDVAARTGEVARVMVSDEVLGRVLDPLGRPLDDGPEIHGQERIALEREAPEILDRREVTVPLVTGTKSVDAMVPVGRGQRELIIGDRSTGKTTIAVDAILSQKDSGVICVYTAIGKQASEIARVVETLRAEGALGYTVVVAADADDPAGMRYAAPYAGCSVSEYFMEKGRDTLVVYDDLTRHARTYREISLLLRRPPGREAYPGDIFYIHSRLLERATQLNEEQGGGSQTALPIVETQEQNLSAYIPTNLISITDGQIYLNPELYRQGFLPAVDIGQSVSRVGGKTQIEVMKEYAPALRLRYTRFRELEEFTRFGASLESETRTALERGRRVREVLIQPAHQPVPLQEQAALFYVVSRDFLMEIPLDRVEVFEERFRRKVREESGDLLDRIAAGEVLEEEDEDRLMGIARDVREELMGEG